MVGKKPTKFIIVTYMLLACFLLAAAVPTPGMASSLPQLVGAEDAAPNQQVPEYTSINLKVVAARTEPKANGGAGVTKGAQVDRYKYLISQDNTGDPFDTTGCNPYLDAAMTQRNPNYPADCDWPSIRTVPGWAPVYTQGTEADFDLDTALSTLPAGKYLITVMADGYRIDGKHFEIPMKGTNVLEVAVHPLPLPAATMTILVFEDKSMTNGQFDAPAEHGLAGFRVSLNDIAGEITTDLYGNPLCTEYRRDANNEVILDADGMPAEITKLGQGCVSDADGMIVIPNIGPIRYDVLMVPPDGQAWVQTTTLEGSQGWDTWLQEGGLGMDNEFVVAAEPFPWTIFGFVKPSTANLPAAPGTGAIHGTVMATSTFAPMQGGLPFEGDIWGGWMGTKVLRPVERPWLALNDLQNGDTAIWVGQGNLDGSFDIPNVPAGNYTLTYWDEKQHFILDFVQVTVNAGQTTDTGVRTLTGWFTEVTGTIFSDNNENGKRDPGEPGIPNYLVVLKDRDNTEIDRMSITSLTDPNGKYAFEKAYPMGSWMVLEAYSDLYHTTGITYQVTNQPEETTVLGAGVDVAVLPILGQPVRLDWGVKPYGPNENGGIVGTVFYDTVRAEDDASKAGAEPWQPGIPNLTMNLYAAVKDAQGKFVKNPTTGAFEKGALLATTTTETFERPKNCQARDVDGNPVDFPALAPATGDFDCLEAPMMGTQIGLFPTPDGVDFGAKLDGNYGFTEIMFGANAGQPLPAGDYLVEVVIPNDPVTGRKLYQVTREEDQNIFSGDTYTPAIPQPPCAGETDVVDVAGLDEAGNVIGANTATPVINPSLYDAGGNRFEGQTVHRCDVKLITLNNGKSIAPPFQLFTEVPIPGKWKGYIVDDLNVSTNAKELFFGEKAGVPYSPIGIYDWSGRLVRTVHSDANGVYEVLLPSTGTVNAPTPSGMTAGMYYLYGNDPGTPDAPNYYYNPQYRSIGATFEIYPGVIVPSDLAPVQNGISIFAPGSNQDVLPQCKVSDTTPQFFRVDVPYIERATNPTGTLTIQGIGFGATRGTGRVMLNEYQASVTSWTDRTIVVTVPTTMKAGIYQLQVIANNGKKTANGITIHVLGSGYNPKLYTVGPGKAFNSANTTLYNGDGRGPIQHALDVAALEYDPARGALVVVYPGVKTVLTNPTGSYFENLVVFSPVRLQGVGPGGVNPEQGAPVVDGTHIDGRAVGGDTPYSTWWRSNVMNIWETRGGWGQAMTDANNDPRIFEGSVITVYAQPNEFRYTNNAMIDGFVIEGGDQQGFPNNINKTGDLTGQAPNIVVQGGGIYVNGHANYLQISNNIIRSNGGSYGGGIRLGTPNLPQPYTDSHNDNIRIMNNRLIANGSTNLAGAIGVFAGSDGYEIGYNDICGNFSAEYGGGISHYGLSPNGNIHHNRIYFNRSYDEGGGIMIAGELPADFTQLSPGAGPVNVFNNLIQSNLANDDGGGLRFLMAGNFPYNVYNNVIVNNVSTHEGGGVSLNDAPDVRVYNNTIMKNITTATAMTSDGLPAPAGLSSSRNSTPLQLSLPAGSPSFSKPLLFNNIFWDNRAGSWNGDTVMGIGLAGDAAAINYWDMGVSDGSGILEPVNTILQHTLGTLTNASNKLGADPQVLVPYETSVRIYAWRGNANFRGADIVALDLPVDLMGDYHVNAASPAVSGGTRSVTYKGSPFLAPYFDFDGQWRGHKLNTVEIGADEMPGEPAPYSVFMPAMP